MSHDAFHAPGETSGTFSGAALPGGDLIQEGLETEAAREGSPELAPIIG